MSEQSAAEAMRETAVKLCEAEREKFQDTNADRFWQSNRLMGMIAALPAAPSEPRAEGRDAQIPCDDEWSNHPCRRVDRAVRSANDLAAIATQQTAELTTLRADLARMKAAMEKCREALAELIVVIDRVGWRLRTHASEEAMKNGRQALDDTKAALKGTSP